MKLLNNKNNNNSIKNNKAGIRKNKPSLLVGHAVEGVAVR